MAIQSPILDSALPASTSRQPEPTVHLVTEVPCAGCGIVLRGEITSVDAGAGRGTAEYRIPELNRHLMIYHVAHVPGDQQMRAFPCPHCEANFPLLHEFSDDELNNRSVMTVTVVGGLMQHLLTHTLLDNEQQAIRVADPAA